MHELHQVTRADSVTSQGQGDYESLQPDPDHGDAFVTAGYVARAAQPPVPSTNHWIYERFSR